jgi:hypothetical protein
MGKVSAVFGKPDFLRSPLFTALSLRHRNRCYSLTPPSSCPHRCASTRGNFHCAPLCAVCREQRTRPATPPACCLRLSSVSSVAPRHPCTLCCSRVPRRFRRAPPISKVTRTLSRAWSRSRTATCPSQPVWTSSSVALLLPTASVYARSRVTACLMGLGRARRGCCSVGRPGGVLRVCDVPTGECIPSVVLGKVSWTMVALVVDRFVARAGFDMFKISLNAIATRPSCARCRTLMKTTFRMSPCAPRSLPPRRTPTRRRFGVPTRASSWRC